MADIAKGTEVIINKMAMIERRGSKEDDKEGVVGERVATDNRKGPKEEANGRGKTTAVP